MRQLNRRNIENRAIFDVVVGVFVFWRFFDALFGEGTDREENSAGAVEELSCTQF